MEAFQTLSEAERALRSVHSGATGTDIFMAKCFPLMMKIFLKQKTHRKPTKWNRFCARYLKEGKTLRQISKMYSENRNG